MKGNLWQVGLLAVLLVLLLPAANIALSNSGSLHSETTTLTVQTGEKDVVEPTEANALEYYDNETVFNATNDTLTEGQDYEWFTENHTVEWFSSTNHSDGDEATLNYSYTGVSDSSAASRDVLAGMGAFIGIVFFLAVIGYLLNITLGSDF